MSHSPRFVGTPSSGCFHCGLPIPRGAPYPIQYENQTQQTCCAGCQAVAQTIIDSGQGAYYVHRTALPVTPRQIEAELAQLGLYDLPEIQQSFVRVEDEHIREAALMLENIVCAACVWLNERHIAALPGVLSVDILRDAARAGALGRESHPVVGDPQAGVRYRLPRASFRSRPLGRSA